MAKKTPIIRPSPQQIDHYEERAAILEYDGGLSREEAEEMAWKIVFGNRFLKQEILLKEMT
jgi:hypothetical protein